jgi:hypothetical protein
MEPPSSSYPSPPPPSPFSPTGPAPAPSRAGGCGKPVVIGCLVLVVLAGLGLVGMIWYASTNYDKLMRFSLRQSEGQILAQLPGDVTPGERQRLEEAFDAAVRAAETRKPGEIAAQSQEVQYKMLELVRKGQDLTREDVRELTELLEKMGGVEQPKAETL